MTEQSKTPAATPEQPPYPQPQPQPVLQYGQPYVPGQPYPPNAYPPPPGAAPYPYFYAPPAEGADGQNPPGPIPPGAYVMMPAPPGMVYMHPPQPPARESFPESEWGLMLIVHKCSVSRPTCACCSTEWTDKAEEEAGQDGCMYDF